MTQPDKKEPAGAWFAVRGRDQYYVTNDPDGKTAPITVTAQNWDAAEQRAKAIVKTLNAQEAA